jgi:hypothetical protein
MVGDPLDSALGSDEPGPLCGGLEHFLADVSPDGIGNFPPCHTLGDPEVRIQGPYDVALLANRLLFFGLLSQVSRQGKGDEVGVVVLQVHGQE